jgi:hypothetical protein
MVKDVPRWGNGWVHEKATRTPHASRRDCHQIVGSQIASSWMQLKVAMVSEEFILLAVLSWQGREEPSM